MLTALVGWYLVVLGGLMLLRTDHVKTVMEDLISHRASFFIMSLLMFVAGMIMVMSHSVWVYDWEVAVTIFAWIILIKGVGRLFYPEYCINWIKMRCMHAHTMRIFAFVYILIGLYILMHVYPMVHFIY